MRVFFLLQSVFFLGRPRKKMRWDQLAATASNQPALAAADGKNNYSHGQKAG